jgi:dipeptidyl aminopeptidase/acylaminoacyl peptidase
MKTVEDLVAIPGVSFPAWSPQGDAVAFLAHDPAAGWQVSLYEIATNSVRLLSDRSVTPARLTWMPDGSSVVVGRPNEEGGSDIWCVPTRDAESETRLVSGPYQNRSPAVSPDGQWIAYLSAQAGALDVWIMPTSGGTPRQLTEKTNPLDESRWMPRWSPDGQWIAYVSSRSGERNNDDVWLASVDGSDHRQLTVGIIVNSNPAWSPDGRWIAVVANTETEHWYGDDADIWRVDPQEGPSVRLTPGGGHTRRLEGAGITWSADGAAVFALAFHNGDQNVTSVPADGGVRTRVTNLSGQVTDMALSPDGELLVLIHESQTRPSNLVIMPVEGGRLRHVTRTESAIQVDLMAPERIPYRTFDGLYCDAYLYLPPNFDERRRYPGLIQVHGGGTNAYGNGWHPLEQWLAVQGFVVYAIEYRGSSGYGREFANLSYADWGGDQTLDAVAAGRWLLAQPYISRIGIYGQSYGGFMTLHSIVAEPELFGAAVDLYGKTNAFTGQANADRVGRLFSSRDYWGRYAHEVPEAMRQASTVHRLDRIKTPLLIMHGDEDTRVPPIESEQVAEVLSQSDVPHEYVVYPGEGHGFRKWEHRADCYTRMLRWFETYLCSKVDENP